MIQNYRSLEGQSIYDVCLMTYGTLDLLYQLIKDNNYTNVNFVPAAGTVFTWEDTLVIDEKVFITNQTLGVSYSTSANSVGSSYYDIQVPGVASTTSNTVPPITISYLVDINGDFITTNNNDRILIIM